MWVGQDNKKIRLDEKFENLDKFPPTQKTFEFIISDFF